ncbi:MAG: hypothetical protein U1F33_10940 [Alphaproteobacteria bacterium]
MPATGPKKRQADHAASASWLAGRIRRVSAPAAPANENERPGRGLFRFVLALLLAAAALSAALTLSRLFV